MSVDRSGVAEGETGWAAAPLVRWFSSWIEKSLEVTAAALLAVIVMDVALMVVARYILGATLAWTEELARALFLWLIFLGASVGISREAHVAVDSLVAFLPSLYREAVEFLIDVVVAATCVMLLTSGLEMVQLSTSTLPALGWSEAWRYAVIPIAAALNLFFLALRSRFGRDWMGVLAVLLGAATYFAVFTTGLFTFEANSFSPSLIMIAVFTILLAGGVPVAFTMISGAYLASWAHDLLPPAAVVHNLSAGVDSFILIAIPLFVFAGIVMNAGGASDCLFRLAGALVGHLTGGLAHVNVLSSYLFGGISGSSVADAAGLSKILVPSMVKEGYGPGFAAALTSASAILPNIVPPSIAMLMYASISNVSVGNLFLAGYLPGAALGLGLVATAYVISRRRGYGTGKARVSGKELASSFMAALPALFLTVIIVGGIRGGVFTPTEAGAAAAVYAVFLGIFVYRKLTLRALWRSFTEAALDTASVGFLISAAAPFAWVLIAERMPQQFGAWALSFSRDPLVLLLIINVILFLVGLPLELPPAMMILMPVFLPVIIQVGIDPIHFGVVVITNLMIGAISPPVGILVFITSSIGKVPVGTVFREVTPFMLVLLAVTLILTYVPAVTMFIPRLFGL
jgi:tripartite ATP-independent transporter DctM subunit